MHQWIVSALVQIMACCLYGTKPISEPMLDYCPRRRCREGTWEWWASVRACMHLTVRQGFPTVIWKSNRSINFKFGVCICWFGPSWSNFRPLVDRKWLNMVVSDHILKKYSCHPIQTWCVHLLGECSELIRFWATLAKFWPSSGQKMTENGDFRPFYE